MREVINEITRFLDKSAEKPFFWIIAFAILLVVSYVAISRFGDK